MKEKKKRKHTYQKTWLSVLFTLTVLLSATFVGYGATSHVNVKISFML